MKSTAVEVESRVLKVSGWLEAGWSRAKICEYARENEGWDVSDSQIDRYIAQARSKLRDGFEDDWETNRAIANARLESLYCVALEKGDLRAALRIIAEQVALQKPESAKVSYANDADFILCLDTYAKALRRVLPESMLIQVVEAVRELTPVAESFEEVIGFDYDKAMQGAVDDIQTLGRTRTREELIEAGFFEGLALPD